MKVEAENQTFWTAHSLGLEAVTAEVGLVEYMRKESRINRKYRMQQYNLLDNGYICNRENSWTQNSKRNSQLEQKSEPNGKGKPAEERDPIHYSLFTSSIIPYTLLPYLSLII